MNALGLRVEFRPAKWPENMKNARSGKLMLWSIGLSSAAPDGQPTFDGGASIHMGGQNLARFRDERFDRLYARMQVMPDGPERLALFDEALKIMLGVQALQVPRAPDPHGPRARVAARLSPAAVLEHLVAVRRHRRRGAGAGYRMSAQRG